MDDLAKGTGGGYRYIFSKSDPDEQKKIVHVVLLRSPTKVSTAPLGWDAISEDLNKGRRKTYLYILLKTVGGPAPAPMERRCVVYTTITA